jgi:hypothetical protein
LYTWIQKKTGPASKLLNNDDEFDTHSKHRLSVLFTFPEGDEEGLKIFQALAAAFDDIPFAHSHHSGHKGKLEISNEYALVLFRSFDEGTKFL